MMICKECGNELIANAAFCTNCGVKLEQKKQNDNKTIIMWQEENWVVCKSCGAQNMEGLMFCMRCGARIVADQQPSQMTMPIPGVQPVQIQYQNPKSNQLSEKQEKSEERKKKKEKKSGKSKNILAAIGMAMVMAAAVIALGITARPIIESIREKLQTQEESELVYLKGNTAYLVDKETYESQKLTNQFYTDADEYNGVSIDYYNNIQYSEDGKNLFYIKNYSSMGGDLCYKEKDSGGNESLVASNVINYKIMPKGRIFYRDNFTYGYYSDLKSYKRDLGMMISMYDISEDEEETLMYIYDTGIFVESTKYEIKEKPLFSLYTTILYNNENYTEIYYLNQMDDTLYLCEDFEKKIAIDTNVTDAWLFEENGIKTIYYCKALNTEEYSLYDLVEDDLGEQYDYIREQLGEESINFSECIICAFNFETGEKQQILTFYGDGDVQEIYNSDGEVELVIYNDININAIEKIKFSEVAKKCYIDKEAYVYEMIKNHMKEQALFYLLTKQGSVPVSGMGDFYKETVEIYNYRYSLEANTTTKEIYIPVCYEIENQEYTYDLYTISYAGEAAECRLITNRVDTDMYNTYKGIYYLADQDNNGKNSLFLNGYIIDDNVSDVLNAYTASPFASFINNENALYYIKDVDDNNEGTLCRHKNGKVTEIANNVSVDGYSYLGKGKIAYLADYDYNEQEGDLYLFNGRESIEIDSGITTLLKE